MLTSDTGGNQGRLGSEPPASDAQSQRSFVEESHLYGGADVGTPRQPRPPQRSPVRSSARLAGRDSVSRDDTGPPTPTKPPTSVGPKSRAPIPVSDSIDEEDEEDPLANPTPRGLRRIDRSASQPPRGPATSAPNPDLLERIRLAGLNRSGPRPLSVSEESEEEPSELPLPVPPRNPPIGARPVRPNPVRDAKSGEFMLPRPKHFNNPDPRSGNASGNDILPDPLVSGAARQPTRRAASNAPGPSLGNRNEADPVRVVDDRDLSDSGEEEGLFSVAANALLAIFRASKWPRWLRKGLEIWGLLILLCMLFLILLELFVPVNRWEGVSVGKNYTLHGIAFWRQNIAQIIPWIVLHPFAVLTGSLDYADFRNTLRWAEINAQHNKIRLDFLAGATHQMRRILPELIAIKVDTVSKEWSVEDSFWHALDEQAKQGGIMYSLLTMEKSEDGTYIISDPHWDAIRRRIESDGTLISDRPALGGGSFHLTDEVMAYVDQSMSNAWAKWLKDNEEAIKRAQGVEHPAPSPHWQDLYGNVEEAVARRLKDLGLEEQIISKEEFIQEIQHQSNQYAAQIRSEMDTIQGKLGRALEIAEEAKESAEAPAGISRLEVKEMIDEAVQRSIADAQLEAIAKGHIKSHLDHNLIQRKNYFSTIRGAVIDRTLTSTSYQFGNSVAEGQDETPLRRWTLFRGKQEQKVFREGGKDSGVTFAPGKALETWEEDGECWCAGLADAKNFSGVADLSIMTADTVVPQHLVVEHIASAASFDPQSMPKDIEVWIRTPTDKRRRRLEHWSKERWADLKRPAGKRLLDRGFVKVGEFQYDNSVGKGESQVFKLSEDLLSFDAQTRQVLVRAKTNYGAVDHTCFYRLRLFGEEGRGQSTGALE